MERTPNTPQTSNNSSGQLMGVGRHCLALYVVLAVYLAITLVYGQLTPLGEAPDEIAHMDLIRFIGEEGHLPRNAAERQLAGYKSDSPMLYHAVVGAATSWIDYEMLPRLKVNDLSPRHLLINDGLSPFNLIHTDDETPPYQGIVLAWHLGRLASTLFGVGTLAVIYSIVLRIRPDDHWLALGTTATIAAIPRFHFMASVVNDDNLLGLLSALFTLTLLRAWQRPKRRRTYIWLGLWFGLTLTTKYAVMSLLPLVLIVLVRAVHRRELSWGMATGRLLIFGAAVAVAAAWWFIYVEWHFNEIRQLGLVAGLTKPLSFDASTERATYFLAGGTNSAPSLLPSANATIWDWVGTLFRTFWFVQGEANPTIGIVLSLIFLGLSGLAIAGLWRAWRRRDNLPWATLDLLALQVGLLLPVPFLRFYLTHNAAEAGQGRHILFPAVAAVGLLLTLGISAWFPSARRRFVGLGLAVILLVISLVSYTGSVLPAFPPRLPVRTSADAAKNVSNPINASFPDEIELVSYQVGEINEYGALPVTLIWHSQAYVNRAYLVELSLLDDGGEARSMSLGHPVQGHYPTRAWEPGDVVRDTVWLPLTGLETGDYQLQLHLKPVNSTSLSAPESGILLENVVVPPLPPRSSSYALEFSSGESVGFDVWQTGQPTENMPVYKYRAAIPVTFLESQPKISLVGPDGVEQTPKAQASDTYIFIVDAFWPSGEYVLRAERAERAQGVDEQVESDSILRIEVRPRNFDVPPMSNEVHASFGDEVTLLGFDFPKRRAQPGDALPITLYWQARRPMDHHYIVSNHLLNRADLRQWGGRDRVPQDYYSTVLWTPGEVVQDEYVVPVDPSAPNGIYFLDVGLYVELVGQRWHLPLVQNGEALNSNSVSIATIKVGGPPSGVTVEAPSPQRPHADNLADFVTFLGYDLSLETEALYLTLYWRCDAQLPADYTTFVHVRDTTGGATGQPGTIVAQMDRPPADGAYPTSLWDPGEVIRDSIRVPVRAPVPAGEYEIVIGLYDFASGKRLPVLDDQGKPTSDYISLEQEITVR